MHINYEGVRKRNLSCAFSLQKKEDMVMKKRMIALLIAGVMAVTMCGCGSKSEEKKVYKVATDTTFAPFEFENDEGNMVGIDLDLLKAIAEDQGFEYELES